jgi:uncharacterized protein (TIGR02145 family)
MKTKFFIFAMLASVIASAQVTNVAPIGANYANKTISFRVWWNAGSRDVTHLSKVWVWVDYIKVNSNNTTSGNMWTRATVGIISGGTTSYDGSNQKGFWLEGNASTNYSATLTVQLTNVPDKFNWCAYGSDYPPNVAYNNVTYNSGTYTFSGTPPFRLVSADGSQTKEFNKKSITVSEIGFVPKNFTDATGCPGIGFCPYTGSDEFMDASHFCHLRTIGARNWETYIKDTRDNELYRIVFMPDNKWWLVQNVRYALTGSANTYGGCTPAKCGYLYTGIQMSSTYTGSIGASGYGANKQGVCPNNWVLPVYNDWRAFTDAIDKVPMTQYNVGNGEWLVGTSPMLNQRLAAADNPVVTGNNYYGWAEEISTVVYGYQHEAWRANSNQYQDWGFIVAFHAVGGYDPSATNFNLSIETTNTDRAAPVRCFRQL